MEINLISDTFTKPTPDMLEFMMSTKVGNDVFDEDPSANLLQEKVANLFGKEDALFFPSGTMANQAAIKIHTMPGQQVICDKWAHIFNFEGGGVAFNSGVSCALIDGNRGMFTAQQVEELINPDSIHFAETRLVAVENTTNKGGGACWDINELARIKKVCDSNSLAYHLDGARLFNAMMVKNERPEQYGSLFDTISICFSKSFGAPIGSVLLGSNDQIKKAKKIRKLLGGAMCQVGYLAAAGIYALDNHIERLSEDHRRAKVLGETLAKNSLIKSIEPIETNIVIFNLIDNIDDQQFINALKKENILIISMGNGKLRMVTHLDFTDEMLEKVIQVLDGIKIQ